MEPNILIVGRKLAVIKILISELENYKGILFGADNTTDIQKIIEKEKIDIVVMGGGLPDKKRKEISTFIAQINNSIPVHIIEREENSSPSDMIDFTNKKVVEFKVQEVLKR